MNAKSILFLSLFAAVTLAVSGVSAASRGGGNFTSMGGGHPVMRGGAGTFSGNFRHFDRFHRFDRFDRFHHHNFNEFIFIGDFGFPWWWGWGWGWGYPYGYYGGYNYGGYGSGYGYGDNSGSRVAELQSRLASAGYYHGAIDGIMGPATRRAIRAYERHSGYVS